VVCHVNNKRIKFASTPRSMGSAAAAVRSHLTNLLLSDCAHSSSPHSSVAFHSLTCTLHPPTCRYPLPAISSPRSQRHWSAVPFSPLRHSRSAGRIDIATSSTTNPIASDKYGVLGWEHRNYLIQDSPNMVLTHQGTSPRDPDKFPAAQLFLLG
jgi:hypothetical protein